jgi:3-hydroxyisobutyrate dehydrogenase-like beta-hydroxyacid dehydrogenase
MTKIGIAGVGRMGRGMLANMRAAGIEAEGFDIRPESDFPSLPVTSDATAFATELETLLTVVRDADQTDEVLFGTQGFVSPGRILYDENRHCWRGPDGPWHVSQHARSRD